MLHSSHYPFATSRDTTAAGFVSEAGLSPLDVDDIIVVLRAFPIRVAGNSGPLRSELSWDDVTRESGSGVPLAEYTSVTKVLRRVGRFDAELVRQALLYNAPTRIVLNHLDYIDAACIAHGGLTASAVAFLRSVEAEIGAEIQYVGYDRQQLYRIASEKRIRAV